MARTEPEPVDADQSGYLTDRSTKKQSVMTECLFPLISGVPGARPQRVVLVAAAPTSPAVPRAEHLSVPQAKAPEVFQHFSP